MKTIELFVPGRLCILGEHSDWAGTYRMINAGIVPGMAIVTGIRQGIRAKVSEAERFIFETETEDGQKTCFECDMDTGKLREAAAEGGFFSYVAGVTSYVNEHFKVGGLRVTVEETDLPVKRGLSSSAAVCVLVARAFNRIYDLHLNTAGEMNIAYMGEQRTPSRCGRMDQACAYGNNPVYMVFDGVDVQVHPLTVKSEFHWLIADLNSHKDTKKILHELSHGYPFAADETDRQVQEALGRDNRDFVERAVACLEQGSCEELGRLMDAYQENFDRKVAPACPSELTAPVLHSVLADPHIRQWIYGCKGVGSQGDGMVQFLTRGEQESRMLSEYLLNRRGMDSVPFVLRPKQAITRAIIPLAGYGTRLFPATKCIKKGFLPVVDADGALKPAILILLEQLEQAGIQEICLVIGEGEEAEYEKLFASIDKAYYRQLPADKRRYEDTAVRLGTRISYVIQKEKRGFGDAVYLCRDFAAGEPVLLLLGDTLYRSHTGKNCMRQMVELFERYGMAAVSVHPVERQDVIHYGILHGKWEKSEACVMRLDTICEKPDVEYARDYLRMGDTAAEEKYYAVFGQYILTEQVFDALKAESEKTRQGEVQLTPALDAVIKTGGMLGFAIEGTSYDLGIPEKYRQAMAEFGG